MKDSNTEGIKMTRKTFQIETDDLRQMEDIADKLYAGNLSMAIRLAIKEYISRHGEPTQ